MINKMELIKNIMKSAGWFDKSPDGLPDYSDQQRIKTSALLCSKEWEEQIREKKEQTLQEHISNIHTNNIQNRLSMIKWFSDE